MSARPFLQLCLAVSFALTMLGLQPSCALQDNFDEEPGFGDGASGLSQLDYLDFFNWNVAAGTVDLIAEGDFGFHCLQELGKCVDLDGSLSDSGFLVSKRQLLMPGYYTLSFALAGAPASRPEPAAKLPNVVEVKIEDYYHAVIERLQGDPFETFGGQFTVTDPTTVYIVISNPGDDNFGAVLDNVVLLTLDGPAGDFDEDFDVDGNDFLHWQRGVGQFAGAALRSNGDANGNGFVEPHDLALWQQSFGQNWSSDFDLSGRVDGSDFLQWQRGLNQFAGNALSADGDANCNGFVESSDLVLWQARYGATEAPTTRKQANNPSREIPEPASLSLITGSALAAAGLNRRNTARRRGFAKGCRRNGP